MPTYTYLCPECEAEWENFHPIAERHSERCMCGAKPGIVPRANVAPEFQAGWDGGLGMYVESRDQRRAEIKRQGLVEVGGESVETMEREAKKNKPKVSDYVPDRVVEEVAYRVEQGESVEHAVKHTEHAR